MSVRQPPRCPRCATLLDAPGEHPDGLPGVLYRVCGSCGYSAAVVVRSRKERLPSRKEGR